MRFERGGGADEAPARRQHPGHLREQLLREAQVLEEHEVEAGVLEGQILPVVAHEGPVGAGAAVHLGRSLDVDPRPRAAGKYPFEQVDAAAGPATQVQNPRPERRDLHLLGQIVIQKDLARVRGLTTSFISSHMGDAAPDLEPGAAARA